PGLAEAALSCVDASGNLVWSVVMMGSQLDYGSDVAASGDRIAFVGLTRSPDFPTTANAFDRTHGGLSEGFVALFDRNGSLLLSSFVGGSHTDWANSVTFDADGHVIVSGITVSADFPVTPGTFQTQIGGGYDMFLTELDPALSGTAQQV